MTTTINDVIRYLIRGQGHPSTAVERDLLLTVDAAEQGYDDLESYKDALAQKGREDAAVAGQEIAGAGAGTGPSTAAGMSDEALEAELARRQAKTNATRAAVAHAEATGVDLASVKGTGSDGTITKADVAAAAGGA